MLGTISQTQRIFFYVFIGLFAAVSIFHLVVSFLENRKLRRISKPFCLIFLGLASVCVRPTDGWPIYLGAFFGAVGDIFLIKKDKVNLVIGCTSFFLGHICYIGYMLTILYKANIMPWWGYLVAFGSYLVVVGICIKPMIHVATGNKFLGVGMSIYFGSLLASLGTSVGLATLGPSNLYALCVAGALLFILSDTVLIFTIFRHGIKRKDFYIMLTYLAAECLIILTLTLVAI